MMNFSLIDFMFMAEGTLRGLQQGEGNAKVAQEANSFLDLLSAAMKGKTNEAAGAFLTDTEMSLAGQGELESRLAPVLAIMESQGGGLPDSLKAEVKTAVRVLETVQVSLKRLLGVSFALLDVARQIEAGGVPITGGFTVSQDVVAGDNLPKNAGESHAADTGSTGETQKRSSVTGPFPGALQVGFLSPQEEEGSSESQPTSGDSQVTPDLWVRAVLTMLYRGNSTKADETISFNQTVEYAEGPEISGGTTEEDAAAQMASSRTIADYGLDIGLLRVAPRNAKTYPVLDKGEPAKEQVIDAVTTGNEGSLAAVGGEIKTAGPVVKSKDGLEITRLGVKVTDVDEGKAEGVQTASLQKKGSGGTEKESPVEGKAGLFQQMAASMRRPRLAIDAGLTKSVEETSATEGSYVRPGDMPNVSLASKEQELDARRVVKDPGLRIEEGYAGPGLTMPLPEELGGYARKSDSVTRGKGTNALKAGVDEAIRETSMSGLVDRLLTETRIPVSKEDPVRVRGRAVNPESPKDTPQDIVKGHVVAASPISREEGAVSPAVGGVETDKRIIEILREIDAIVTDFSRSFKGSLSESKVKVALVESESPQIGQYPTVTSVDNPGRKETTVKKTDLSIEGSGYQWASTEHVISLVVNAAPVADGESPQTDSGGPRPDLVLDHQETGGTNRNRASEVLQSATPVKDTKTNSAAADTTDTFQGNADLSLDRTGGQTRGGGDRFYAQVEATAAKQNDIQGVPAGSYGRPSVESSRAASTVASIERLEVTGEGDETRQPFDTFDAGTRDSKGGKEEMLFDRSTADTSIQSSPERGKSLDSKTLVTTMSDRIAKFVDQQKGKLTNSEMVMRLKVGDDETVLLGLRDGGQRVVVEIKSASEGIMALLQSQKEEIGRHLESRNIQATIFIDPNSEGNDPRKQNKRQSRRQSGQDRKQQGFIEFLEGLA
jgi:hypothetical protein